VTEPPVALLAELTYRCPLRCAYCSNPTDWRDFDDELDTATWARVLREAADLGALHVHFSGGEPLLRGDLEALVRAARDAGLYTNLITSAWRVTRDRLAALADAGLDHVQVSVQDSDPLGADRIAGTSTHAHKLEAARTVKALGMALSVNAVLHRQNLARVRDIIALAESVGAERLELANTQWHGSALAHRDALMPDRETLARAQSVALAERARLQGRMDVIWVIPDWYEDAPRPCMDGWGRRFVTVIPDGVALPCPGAHGLPGMVFDSVRRRSLGDIWRDGADFARYRGTEWMSPTCASCERREVDFGGCRCQAFALTGDPARTDPACGKSPDHGLVRALRRERPGDDDAPGAPLYRIDTRRRGRAS
jgi:PqqA peptide cyclase